MVFYTIALMPVKEKIRLAMQHQRNGELEKAKSIYLEILRTESGQPDALHLYGLACHQQGDHKTAVDYIRKAVQCVPGEPVLRNNLGDALRRAGDLDGAAKQLHHALRLKPDYAGAHLNLGSVYYDASNRTAALHHAQEAARLAPERADAWFNLGLVLLDQLELEEAAEGFRRALENRPIYPAAASSYLYTLNLLPSADPAMVAKEHQRISSQLFASAQPMAPGKRLDGPVRIGYVSGDFKAHAVNYFFEPLLRHHDSERFETFCYSDVDTPDAVSQRLEAFSDHWKEIAGWPDEAVIRQINADRIDVLFDLAGYTKHNRLSVFASRAAPLQIGFLGYPNTTGLETMDYRVVDEVTAPPGEPFTGSESPMRLAGGFACFSPPAHAPPVALPQRPAGDPVTFGSFHKLEKINRDVIETWAEVLHRSPDSRLLMMRDELDEWQQRRLAEQFSTLGIGPDRLLMKRFNSTDGTFLKHFAEIDIQLDTFPWSGHTMACMALWMGVPVVSLHGNSHAGRMVASVLRTIGLDDLLADDRSAYVHICRELGSRRQRLADLRAGLRQRMEKSALLDGAGFTRTLENAILAASASR